MPISNGVKKILKKLIPLFLISRYHFFLAFFGAVLYRFPSRKLSVIGVTGTNGKSTVVEMIVKVLEEASYKVASISSIKFKIGDKEWLNTLKMTMPGRLKLQRFLREALNSGCQYAVIEVTSEGIKQHRHRFIDFDIAVITNLTPEHIESHGGFKKYRQAKGELFQITKKVHIINLDDENADYFLGFQADEKWGYNISSKFKAQSSKLQFKIQDLVHPENLRISPKGVGFSIDSTRFNLTLLGRFNIYNALAAICVGISRKIDLETCKKALEKVETLPGRMEIVIREPFRVIVDYAHTPDSLEKVYKTVRDTRYEIRDMKLICVLGSCGGGRDKWKRPKMGEIAAKYCNKIILTNEDPYDEDPSQILSEIKSGISNFQFPISNLYEILDRKKAIGKALQLAKEGDTVIITGKGCESWMCLANGRKIPWNDRKIAKEEFKKLFCGSQNKK